MVITAFRAKPLAQGWAVACLLMMRADPNSTDCVMGGLTALHFCTMWPTIKIAPAVAVLISARADVEARDTVNGATPLAWCARLGAVDAAVTLISQGADVTAVDAAGRRPADL